MSLLPTGPPVLLPSAGSPPRRGHVVNSGSGSTSVCVSSKPQDRKVIMAFIWGYHLSLTISMQSLTWCLIKISLKSLCVVLHLIQSLLLEVGVLSEGWDVIHQCRPTTESDPQLSANPLGCAAAPVVVTPVVVVPVAVIPVLFVAVLFVPVVFVPVLFLLWWSHLWWSHLWWLSLRVGLWSVGHDRTESA